MTVYFLTFHVIPYAGNEVHGQTRGAYINCWIEAENLELAKSISAKSIKNMDWIILELQNAYEINVTDYASGSEGRQFHEQALIDKEVYSIQQYTE
ncbi:MAG TPA: hypothetical protein VK772_07895 [Puia sp.]|jgi:hypothetical protein|nr:hypothetical protein [Puia sp.]